LAADEIIETFYASGAWVKCRRAYMAEKGGLCERCLARGLIEPAAEVHHKIRLTADNVSRPEVALNWDNLECLCTACHKAEHTAASRRRRYTVDAAGRVILPGEAPLFDK
jgi:5-methylcytosine-specific restriction endonuclease McrA